MTLDEFFAGRDEARAIFDRIATTVETIAAPCGGERPTLRVTRSQVAFRRIRNAAIVWTPDRAIGPGRSAPLVLTLSFPEPDPSARWKEITQISPRRFTHHLELRNADEVDDEVRAWLARAWKAAG